MTRKKRSRRDAQERPDLDPKFNLKTRTDLLDQDYLHKLSPEELDWLNKFNKEYVSASLNTESPRKNLHRNKKLRKDCYDRNNARNRDILTRAKASNRLIDYEKLIEEVDQNDVEERLIKKLDTVELIEAVEWLAGELDKDHKDIESIIIKSSEDVEEV